jgi:hypothetical protein
MDKNSKEFKQLQQNWYKKLKDDGFEDIESDEDSLKQWASSELVRTYDPIIFSAKEDYYRLAGQFYHDHKFLSEMEKLIWSFHKDGIPFDRVHALIKKEYKKVKISRTTVFNIVARLAKEMLRQCKKPT